MTAHEPPSEQRSALMALVGPKDTKPEMIVRRLLHRAGYRYVLHAPDLPGRPDLVFRPRRKAIFVHGCFWHRHSGCRRATTPKTRREFWLAKFAANVERDARIAMELEAAGWDAVVVWECETSNPAALRDRLTGFLGPPVGHRPHRAE